MRILKTAIFPAVLLLVFLSGSAIAQPRTATVDMRKIFDNYYKFKLAQAAIQDHKNQLDKDDKSLRDDLQKATDEYQSLLAQANDQAISADERDRRKQAAADKLKQLQDSRTEIEQYERTANTTLNDQIQRMHDKIMDDIQNAVTAKAKDAGCSMVLDTSTRTIALGAGSMDLPSVVVYTDGANDLTDAVLKQLNAGAPIDMSATNSAPGAATAPPLNNKSP